MINIGTYFMDLENNAKYGLKEFQFRRYLISISLLQLLLFVSNDYCYSQNDFSFSDSDFIYGIATKLNIEINSKTFERPISPNDYRYEPGFKLSLTAGFGYNIESIYFTPSVHAGLLLFNSRNIGGDQSLKWSKIQSHIFINGTGTVQIDKRDFNYLERNVPLYHFAEFTANPLQNPYKTSMSLGINYIFLQDDQKQRIGFFNLNIVGRVQLSYYNDGGPVLGWPGDNRDRYYTGGGVLSFHGDISDLVNLIELSYHKYTGYQKYAFDVADKLQIDFLNYFDGKQFAYNQQRWRLNLSNLENGFGGSISRYNNNRWDVQDYLHFSTDVPYHPDYRGKYWMFGARHEYNNSNLRR